jgi:hypothetical protein
MVKKCTFFAIWEGYFTISEKKVTKDPKFQRSKLQWNDGTLFQRESIVQRNQRNYQFSFVADLH